MNVSSGKASAGWLCSPPTTGGAHGCVKRTIGALKIALLALLTVEVPDDHYAKVMDQIDANDPQDLKVEDLGRLVLQNDPPYNGVRLERCETMEVSTTPALLRAKLLGTTYARSRLLDKKL